MHLYAKCTMQLILTLGILFQGILCSPAQNRSRFNETKPEAFQNDHFNPSSNYTSIYSIPFTTQAPNDFTREAPNDSTAEAPNNFSEEGTNLTREVLNNFRTEKTNDITREEPNNISKDAPNDFSREEPITTETSINIPTQAPTGFSTRAKAFITQPPTIEMGHLVFIDKLLSNYDKRVWPTFGTNSPTEVTVNIYINSLGSVNAANMDFGMDIYLRQSWIDPRLQFYQFGINETVTLNGQDIIDKIWKPDLFFRNLKSGQFHTLTVPNKLIKLSPNGRILFSMRLTLRLSCHMSFKLYPLDIQRCWIILGSYAQTVNQVVFKWRPISPLTIEKEIEVPEFQVITQEPGTFWRDIDTGVFSFLNVSFVFLRQNGYHLVQTYLPSLLLVVISWISFWVPVESAPARVTLGITTLLSLTTLASGIRSQLPPVSYAKAIDIWIGACTVMVFAALLEFCLASYLSRMKVRHNDTKCIIFTISKGNHTQIETKNPPVLPIERPGPEADKKIQMRRSHTIDRWSRFVFPSVFVAFMMFYWIYYLSLRAKMEQLYL